ncbi:MAG: pilus assembly protein N-terminal domain-containing protein [Rhizobiaceae bacterium]
MARVSVCRTVVIAALALASAGVSAQAGNIDVVMNQARIVKLARPADTIVVGNPLIADAAVQDSTTIVLTGKGFGVTNLVVLDQEGLPIVDEIVQVSRGDTNTVRVYRRSELQTLSCTPSCEAAYKNEAEVISDSGAQQ